MNQSLMKKTTAQDATHDFLQAMAHVFYEARRGNADQQREAAAYFEAVEARVTGMLVQYQGQLRAQAHGR